MKNCFFCLSLKINDVLINCVTCVVRFSGGFKVFNKKSAVIILFLFVFTGLGAQSEQIKALESAYEQTSGKEAVFDFILILAMQEDQNEFADLYYRILLDYAPEASIWYNPSDVETGTKILNHLLRKLVELDYQDAVDTIFLSLTAPRVPYAVRAEAFRSVGVLGGEEYANDIADQLEKYNSLANSNDNDIEKHSLVAYGCIKALESLKATVAFEPLFFASIGWYKQGIRDAAHKAMKVISDDPTEEFGEMIETEDIRNIEKIQDFILISDYTLDVKTEIMTKIFRRSLTYFSATPNDDRQTLHNIRHRVLLHIIAHEVREPGIEPLLLEAFYQDQHSDVKFLAIEGLARQNTDSSAIMIASILKKYNDYRANGYSFSRFDEALLGNTIDALSIADNIATLSVITVSLTAGHTNFQGKIEALYKQLLAQ